MLRGSRLTGARARVAGWRPRCSKYSLLSDSIPSSWFRPRSKSGTRIEIDSRACVGRGGARQQNVANIRQLFGGGANEVAGIGNRGGARARVRERQSGGELPDQYGRGREHDRRWRGQQQFGSVQRQAGGAAR